MKANSDYRISKLSLKPGDLVVMKCNGPCTLEMAERLRSSMEKIIPTGVKVVVIDKDLDIGVIEWLT